MLPIILYLGCNSSGIIGKFFKLGSSVLTLLNISLQILSSNEWNVITHILPPTLIKSNACFKLDSKTSNSRLTSIRIAWNVFLAGCFSLLYFSGTLFLIISVNSKVVSIGFNCLALIIPLTILLAYFSSPYLYKILVKSSYE